MNIQKTFIYRYKKGTSCPLCIYMCDTQAKNKVLIVPLTNISAPNTYKLSVTNQYAALDSYIEILKDDIISPLFIDGKPSNIPISDFNFISECVISDMIQHIQNDAVQNNNSVAMFEGIYQFLKWKWEKLLLNVLPFNKKTTVYENGLYWASLGVNVGSELNKSRPVLIWKKRCNGNNEAAFSYIIIPITSKDKSKKYYMNVPIDVNGRPCYLRIEDMRRINIKRISRPILDNENKIIFIDAKKRNEIMQAIKRFYLFDNMHTNA